MERTQEEFGYGKALKADREQADAEAKIAVLWDAVRDALASLRDLDIQSAEWLLAKALEDTR